MHFTSLFVAALAGVAQATNVKVVSVGMNPVNNKTGFKFWPDKIEAEPGTMVQFQFWAGNHTVTQSTFDDACIPISNVNASIQGIYSGFQPVDASKADGMIPVYTIMIKDTKPIWLYCSKGKHCQGGMSMVINENTKGNATRSLENYRKGAEGSTASEVIPGSGKPSGGEGGSKDGDNGGDNGGASTTVSRPATPTTIETAVPTNGNEETLPTDGGSPTGGESTQPTETDVTAAAPSFSIPSTMLLALGVAFFLL